MFVYKVYDNLFFTQVTKVFAFSFKLIVTYLNVPCPCIEQVDMIPTPTNAQKCMKVYYPPRKTPNVSSTHVAIFSEVYFKGQLSFVILRP
jgi:hypothetical protein